MKKYLNFSLLGLVATSLFFTSCKDEKTPTPVEETTDQYILMTVADRTQQNGGGYISAFSAFPTGTVSNVIGGKSLTANRGAAGWRIYGNSIYKMFRSADATQGIEKVEIASDGTVTSGKFITSKNPTEAVKSYGTGNFVIINETSGFYYDAAEPLKLQKFNPTTMENTGSIDYAAAVNARGSDVADIKFRAIGQKFLAVKNGKLFANITYGKLATTQSGFWDDYYPNIYIAVIDVATGNYEKTIEIQDAGALTYINENEMYDFDTNGDLYIVTQGKHAQGLGGKSKIVRIKANETDVDASWELKFSEFRTEDNGKFVGVFAKNGRLIVTLNTTPLTGGPTGNINSADIWKFYSVDVSSKQFREITGVPIGSNPGAALAVTEVDNKILLRGSASNGNNGYYEYNPTTNTATNLFQVNEGGAISGFVKITIKK